MTSLKCQKGDRAEKEQVQEVVSLSHPPSPSGAVFLTFRQN